MGRKGEKEVIHSGHFMVSDFEADAQDDEENVLLEIPGDIMEDPGLPSVQGHDPQEHHQGVITYGKKSRVETVSIDSSLTKLFNAMSIAYRHKITSPKWNRFKGLKLRWKDKIRLNNVIWRCWHMQFIRKKRMTVCQFALDVDIHNKPEAIVLEGKYWKRQMEAVTAEYKKWRIYYRNKICGKNILESDSNLFDLDGMDLSRNNSGMPLSFEDGDFSEFMDFTDVLFTSLMNAPQPFAFPNPREIARGTGNSDFIQPGLIQLQPNLDDFMDIVEPLQEMLAGRGLPSVPEEDLLPEVVGSGQNLAAAPTTSATTAPTTTTTGLQYPSSPTTTTFLPSPTHQQQQYRPAIHHHHHHHQDVQQQQQQQVREPTQQQQQLVAVPSQSPPVYPATVPLQQLPQPTTPPQLQQAHTPPLPRTFLRSQSQQELGAGQAAAAPHHDAFAVPKLLPRRRSHSSGGSSNGSGSSGTGLVGSPSLIPHQMISTLTLPNPAPAHMPPCLPNPAPAHMPTTTLPHIAPAPAPPIPVSLMAPAPVIASVQATNSSTNSALLAQLLTSAPYQVNSSNSSPSGSSTGQTLVTTNHIAALKSEGDSIKTTSLVIPGVITGSPYQVASSSGSPSGSSAGQTMVTTSHLTSLKNESDGVKATSLVIPGVITGCASPTTSCITNSNTVYTLSSDGCNVKPVTASLIMPPITLSAVTPSSLKTQTFSQSFPPWSSPCSPTHLIKQSPPHPEPTSPHMVSMPSPPHNKAFRPKSDTERVQYKEHRRVCHINAEQKRRSNLKNNFDIMHQLIPSISQNANAKISKAVMLQKGAEYIQQLKSERQQLTEESEKLRTQIENLSCEISNAQAQLPATGAPMTHARYSKLKEMFGAYVRERTLSNWKFWIFSLITEPLLESYNSSVSTGSLDDLCRSSLAWLDQQCSLNTLRPLVSSSMRKLSTTTNVLANPENLPEEVFRRVTKQEGERFHPR